MSDRGPHSATNRASTSPPPPPPAATPKALLIALLPGLALTALWWGQPALMDQRWEILAWAVGLVVGFTALSMAGRGHLSLAVGAATITLLLLAGGHVLIASDGDRQQVSAAAYRDRLLADPANLANTVLAHIEDSPELAPELPESLEDVEPPPPDDVDQDDEAVTAMEDRSPEALMASPQWEQYLVQREQAVQEYLGELTVAEIRQLAQRLANRAYPPRTFEAQLRHRMTTENLLWLALALATAVAFASGAVDAAWRRAGAGTDGGR